MLPAHYVFGEHKLFVRNERFLLLPFLWLSHEFLPVGGVSEVLPLEVVVDGPLRDSLLFDPFQQISVTFLV
jgi:hypothetical protein